MSTYDITDATSDYRQDSRHLCHRCYNQLTSTYVCDACYQTAADDSRVFCPSCTLPWAEHCKETGKLPFGCAA